MTQMAQEPGGGLLQHADARCHICENRTSDYEEKHLAEIFSSNYEPFQICGSLGNSASS